MLVYDEIKMGELTLCQNGEEYKIELRRSNALATFIYVNKEDGKITHRLVMFFADEQHIKNMLKSSNFNDIFGGNLKDIRLNLYFKETNKMLKYFVRDGYEVTTYYKKNQ